jgi:rRNA-processing protein FCF1
MIILDTDFLVNSIKFKIDIISKIKEDFPKKTITIIDKTLDELENLNNLNSKAAIKLIKIKKIKIIKTKKDKIVDNLILEQVKKEDIVATQDRKLKKELKEKNIKTITIRQKKYINTKL